MIVTNALDTQDSYGVKAAHTKTNCFPKFSILCEEKDKSLLKFNKVSLLKSKIRLIQIEDLKREVCF